MNRKELAKKCREVEKAGGDVLDFLREQGAVSPWGTWWRLQVEELGRGRGQIRDGRGKKMRKRQIVTPEVRAEVEKMILNGEDPIAYLAGLGSKNPGQLAANIKKEMRSKPSPTCCQPAPESGVTVPDVLPEEKEEKADQNGPKTYQEAESTSGNEEKTEQPTEEHPEEEKEKNRRFQRKTMKLKELLPMFRSCCYDHSDEGGQDIVIRPECEEWTWVSFNLNSGLLDLLGELTVETIDADEDDIVLWVKTDDYNTFDQFTMYQEYYKRGRADEAGLRDGTIMQTFSPD